MFWHAMWMDVNLLLEGSSNKHKSSPYRISWKKKTDLKYFRNPGKKGRDRVSWTFFTDGAIDLWTEEIIEAIDGQSYFSFLTLRINFLRDNSRLKFQKLSSATFDANKIQFIRFFNTSAFVCQSSTLEQVFSNVLLDDRF